MKPTAVKLDGSFVIVPLVASRVWDGVWEYGEYRIDRAADESETSCSIRTLGL